MAKSEFLHASLRVSAVSLLANIFALDGPVASAESLCEWGVFCI